MENSENLRFERRTGAPIENCQAKVERRVC